MPNNRVIKKITTALYIDSRLEVTVPIGARLIAMKIIGANMHFYFDAPNDGDSTGATIPHHFWVYEESFYFNDSDKIFIGATIPDNSSRPYFVYARHHKPVINEEPAT